MRKIIWWWNMVYYFAVKWYTKLGDIIHIPFKFLFTLSKVKEFYKRRGVNDIEKTVSDAVKQAQIAETYTRLFLSIFLFIPFFAIVITIDSLLKKYNLYDGGIFGFCGIAIGAFMAVVPLQNYLLGKDDCYKEYFKEFDKMFKTNKRKQHLYGLLSFITVIVLFSTIIFGFLIADKIRLG